MLRTKTIFFQHVLLDVNCLEKCFHVNLILLTNAVMIVTALGSGQSSVVRLVKTLIKKARIVLYSFRALSITSSQH